MHDGLNSVTDIVDPAYAASITACDIAERLAIQQNHSDMPAEITAIRSDCDHVFAAFEAVRLLQLAARDAIDAADHGGPLAPAIAALARLQEAIQVIVQSVGAGWHPGGVR